MIKNFLFLLIASSLFLTQLSGCNAGATKSAESLRANAKAYGKLIRWKAYEDAAKYIKRRDGSEVEIDTELLNEIRVTKYEVNSMVINDTNDEATVLAEIAYYHERVNNVHNIRESQIWWKDGASGAWYLDGQLPPFKK